jgi:four helix bundle protein
LRPAREPSLEHDGLLAAATRDVPLTRFEVHEIALQMICALRPAVEGIRHHNRDLVLQLRRAGSSVPGNIAEGARRAGQDRLHHYRIAAGSAGDFRSHLAVAVAWGDVDQATVDPALAQLDSTLAILWRLTHPRSTGPGLPKPWPTASIPVSATVSVPAAVSHTYTDPATGNSRKAVPWSPMVFSTSALGRIEWSHIASHSPAKKSRRTLQPSGILAAAQRAGAEVILPEESRHPRIGKRRLRANIPWSRQSYTWGFSLLCWQSVTPWVPNGLFLPNVPWIPVGPCAHKRR